MSSDGLKSQNVMKGFLVFLREFKAFRVLVFWLIVGLALGAWLLLRVIPISTVGLFLALTHSFFVGFGIILYFCYRSLKLRKSDGLVSKDLDQFGSVKRELISSLPFFLEGIVDILLYSVDLTTS
ncbi:MAG: hypothetical protein ACREQO_14605 [Candidatus Binatia bacterium]